MKNKILELALLQPNAYPWEKAKLDIDRKTLFKILKDFKLEDKLKRRKLNKLIKIAVLEKSKGFYEKEEIAKEVIKKYQGIIDLNEEIVGKFQWELNLDNNNGLKAYNDFLNNNLKEFEESIGKNFFWLVDIIAFKYCSENEITLEELINEIKHITQSVSSTINYEKYLKLALTKRGYVNDGALKNLKDDIKECTKEIKGIFEESNTNKKGNTNKKIEFDISGNDDEFNIDSIVDIVLNEPTALDFIEEKQESVDIKNEINKEEKIEIKQEEAKNEIDNQEITITKSKYQKPISSDNEREIKIIKDLAHLNNGAVLSELYNCYKNIDKISMDNLEITLSNFFNALNMYGIEVIEEGIKVGQDIKVDTKEVLKEFIFTSPVEVDGEVNGKVEYLGWSYNGKQIVPMVVRPNK